MPRLIWVFAGHTCHFVGFVMRRLRFCHKVLHPKAADIMAKRVDPDHTAPCLFKNFIMIYEVTRGPWTTFAHLSKQLYYKSALSQHFSLSVAMATIEKHIYVKLLSKYLQWDNNKVNVPFSHYKSMKTLSYHSNESTQHNCNKPAPIAQLVECPLRGTGGHWFDPGPRHTKVVKNGTSCSSLGTQTYGLELGLVDPVSG